MPAKAPVDENVRFLYSCLIRSDYHYIDFHMVANDFAINPAAARMRWSRLRKNIALNSSFKNDPNLSVIFGQKKKRKVVDGPPAPPGKKGKFGVKIEGEDDDEVIFVGKDTWKVKAEMKAEGTEGAGQSFGYSVGSIGTDVMGGGYQTGPGGPGQGAHGMQGVDDALARVMDPMLFEISPGNGAAGGGVLGARSVSLGPATVGEASGTGRQTFSMPPGPYAPVIAVGGKAPSPVGFASSSTTIGTLGTGEAEATSFRTKLSGNDGHVSSPTTPLVDIVTEPGAIDSVEQHDHAIVVGKAPTSDAIPETSVTQPEASCIEGDTIILLSATAAVTSPTNDHVLDTIVVDTTAKAPIDFGVDNCSQGSKSLTRRTSRKGSQRNENNYGSDSELTELSENEENHGNTIVLQIPNDGKLEAASSVEAIMSDIPVDDVPARALRARKEKENRAEISGLGEDGEEELEEDYEDEDSDGEWVDERK